jgi:hypothetical protein
MLAWYSNFDTDQYMGDIEQLHLKATSKIGFGGFRFARTNIENAFACGISRGNSHYKTLPMDYEAYLKCSHCSLNLVKPILIE